MNFLESNKKIFWILFTIYFVVSIPLLINFNGIYWDDWILVNQDLSTLNNMFTQAVGFAGYITSNLHYFLINYIGVFSYRLLTFILLFLSGWFVFKILNSMPIFSKKDTFFITIFFLLAPLYIAKIALIDFPYTLFYFIFFLAFYLLSQYYKNLFFMKRIFVLILFFVSFLINSILVFYAIVLIYLFYVSYSLDKNIFKNVINFIQTKIDFILLPIIFYIVKSIWFKSSGVYEVYNQINFEHAFFVKPYENIFLLNFFDPIFLSLKPFLYIFIALFFLLILYSIIVNKDDNKLSKTNNILFLFGMVFFLLAAFPYIVVGKTPMINDWYSRFQVLLPLGFSFILYYGINFIFKKDIKIFLFIILIFSFSIFHIKEQIKYNIDWFYQQSIMENFKKSEIIKNNSTFIVLNDLKNSLVQNRQLRSYELNGMSKLTFGEDARLFVSNEKEIEKYKKYSSYKQYNFSYWIESKPIYLTLKNSSKNKLNIDKIDDLKYLLKLKYLEIMNQDKFKKEVKDLIILEVKQ